MAPSRKFVAWLADPAAKIAVIGASGWIGRAVVDLALAAGATPEDGRLRLFASRAGTMEIAGRQLELEALEPTSTLGPGEWLVLHLAVIGAERVAGDDPTRAGPANDALLEAAMRLAETGRTRRFVFSSSGAVYGAQGAARNVYGAMKRGHEARLGEWASGAGVPLLVARVFNVGGPYINHVSNYALGDFILGLKRDGHIRIAAPHGVFRSYVDVAELARVTFDLALDQGREPLFFDTCGRESVEMADLAQAVGEALGRPGIEILRPQIGEGASDWYVGDGRIYRDALFRSGAGQVDLRTIIGRTADYLATQDGSG